MEGFFETLEKIAILFKVRTMLETDPVLEGLWKKRSILIAADPTAQQTMTDFPNYPDSTDPDVKHFCASANAQLTMYRGKKGIFARTWVIDSAREMPAHLWWDQNGGSVPELQAFARMVLAQPASASICERINSEFEFVKDRRSHPPPPTAHCPLPPSSLSRVAICFKSPPSCFTPLLHPSASPQHASPLCPLLTSALPPHCCRRNRLSHDKANLRVGLFHNLRLLKRMKKPNYTEPAIAWSDDLEKSNVTKYQPGSSSGKSLLLLGSASGSSPMPLRKSPGSYLPPLNEDVAANVAE